MLLNDFNCRFCGIVSGQYTFDTIDEPFAISDLFMGVASIGSFIEGWTLIIPKEHSVSMKSYYERREFVNFVNSVIPIITKHYGPIIAFEHGCNCESSLTSCGTRHAHLHLVPFEGTLHSGLEGSSLDWVKCRASEINKILKNNEYLFYTELGRDTWDDPLGYVHFLNQPRSQFFRRLLANYSGKPDVFDYKLFPFIETAKKTHYKLST